jgi:hypothetical protein
VSFIEPTRTDMFFRSSDIVFGRILEELESYDASGLIDRSTFYSYVKEILHLLGAAVYKEDDGILDIVNNNCKLPGNFCTFWVAYSVRPPQNYTQLKGYDPRCDYTLFHMLEEGTHANYTCNINNAQNKNWKYEIECPSQMDLTSKIAVRYYVDGGSVHNFDFTYPTLLKFGATPNRMYVADNSPCYRSGSPNTISIDEDKFLWTSFKTGCVYLQYWGMPVNKETGLPMIPDKATIEKAVEYYIEYRLLRKWYINNTVADLDRRLAFLKTESDDAIKEALNETKTPSFQSLVRMARNNRNRLAVFQLNDHNYY